MRDILETNLPSSTDPEGFKLVASLHIRATSEIIKTQVRVNEVALRKQSADRLPEILAQLREIEKQNLHLLTPEELV